LLAASLLTSGCLEFGKVDDAKVPGDLLGTFDVSATRIESSCGDGALASSESWRFQVKLSRFQRDLYWLNGREAIVGTIGKDGRSFTFETRVSVAIPLEEGGDPECRISRDDRAEGTLSDDDATVESFQGTLEFSYRIEEGSSCESFLLTPDAPARLPCAFTYDMKATRLPAD
jgi:hypothetical protein